MFAEMRGLLAPGRRRHYVLAGKSTITIMSRTTGTRFTYRVTKSDAQPGQWPVFFVALLSGPDNERDFQYLGTIFSYGFSLTKKSRASRDAKSVVAFDWLSKHWEDPRVEVWHEGVCGRCGRKLTVPESIESGLGPICADK